MSRLLDVYRKDCKAGELGQDDDALTFTYDSDYLPTDPVVVSVFLPKQDEPFPDGCDPAGSRRAHGKDIGAQHLLPVLKTVRNIIETRCAIVRRLLMAIDHSLHH